MTELEAIELELINRELANRQGQEIPQQFSQEELSSKMIPQLTKGLYESLPFGKKAVSMLPNAQQIQQLMETIPRPQGFLPSFARGAGAVAPDLAMSSPFMRTAGLIPKIPAIVKSALGFGAYGGAKAAMQGEQILPSALSSAGSAALFHGAGKLGATALQKLPFGERIGSALGGGLAGQVTGGEEGMALGLGLGALYPATKLQPTEQTSRMAETLINYRLKPSKSIKKYTNPARGISREGLWGKNIADLESKVDMRLGELNNYKDSMKTEAKNLGVIVNLNKTKALKPIYEVLTELQKAPESHAPLIEAINRNIRDIERFGDLSKLPIDKAYELRDLITSLKPSIWKGSNAGEVRISNALRESYHNIVNSINESGISPDLKQTNKRISDLIGAKQTIEDASKANPSYWRMLPLPLMIGYGIQGPLGALAGAGTLAAETVLGTTGISKMLSKKYLKVPKR